MAPFALIPADLVGDHEPKLGRRAYATGSGCPGAVGFQVVGVVLLPCIDDVQDREIEHHRRERWRHDIAYAASVSFMPSHHKCVHLAREASSFPDETVTACWSAAFAYPHAQLAPHRLLTFPPAVPRGPDKNPLSLFPLQQLYTPHGRPRELASRRARARLQARPGFERIELRTL